MRRLFSQAGHPVACTAPLEPWYGLCPMMNARAPAARLERLQGSPAERERLAEKSRPPAAAFRFDWDKQEDALGLGSEG